MTAPAPHSPLAARVAEVERHLERILASGWRNAQADRAGLRDMAGELAELGLAEFSERLRGISQAADAAEAMGRIAVTVAACRMLQARLMAPLPLPPTLEPLPARKETPAQRLLVVAPLSVDGQAVWACARLERGVAAQLVLLEQPMADPANTEPAEPQPRRSGFLRQLIGPSRSAETTSLPWLRAEMHEELQWRVTRPLADSTVDVRAPNRGAVLRFPDEKDDVAAGARSALHGGRASDHDIVVRAGGALRLRVVEHSLAASYTWIDPAVRLAFERFIGNDGWAVAWVTPRSLAPLAIVRPGGLLRRAQLLPLILGAASVTLAD